MTLPETVHLQMQPRTARVTPVVDCSVRHLCRKPYPGHPKGCPNWGKRDSCPPQADLLPNVLDLAAPVYAIWNAFDLASHVARMKEKHPDWSDRQLRCCLYWQGTARAVLRKQIDAFLREHPGLLVLTCPEACGVDVTATMRRAGIDLEWPPVSLAYQVALVGTPLSQPAQRLTGVREGQMTLL